LGPFRNFQEVTFRSFIGSPLFAKAFRLPEIEKLARLLIVHSFKFSLIYKTLPIAKKRTKN
jgi:hypothetical protein